MQGDGGRQVAARAVPADRDRVATGAELVGVVDGVDVGLDAVVQRGRERELRREAVIHRQHPDAGVLGQESAQIVGAVQVADDPAAAVEKDQQRPGLGELARPVQPRRQVTRRGRDAPVGDHHAGHLRAGGDLGRLAHPRAGELGRGSRQRLMAGESLQPEHELGVQRELLVVQPDRPPRDEALHGSRKRKSAAHDRGPQHRLHQFEDIRHRRDLPRTTTGAAEVTRR